MRVLLTHPLVPMKMEYRLAPLGLLYLASYCAPDSEIRVFDQQFDETQSLDEILDDFRPEVVGISIVSPAFAVAAQMVRHLRARLGRGVRLVAGGAHPTAMPESALRAGFDYVVRGEGEETFSELLRALRRGQGGEGIPGLSLLDREGRAVHNEEREPIEDIDRIDMSYESFDLSNPARYDVLSVLSSRGCSMRCIFCPNSASDKPRIRYRSPRHFVDELTFVYQTYHIDWFYIADDQFTSDGKRTREICDLVLDRGMKIHWYTSTRVDTVSRELLEKMKEAGCEILTFGIESGSPEILRRIRKGATLETAKRAVSLCKEVGIRCRTTWIVGLPGSMEEQLQSIDAMREMLPDEIQIYVNTVYPGTEQWDRAEELGIHFDPDSLRWDARPEASRFALDYMRSESILEVTERMLDEMHRLGYATPADHSKARAEGVRMISTFLDSWHPIPRDESNGA